MKKSFLFFTFLLLLAGCDEEKGYTIEGIVANPALNGEYIYLLPYGDTGFHPVDSAQVENGTFVFTGEQDKPILYKLAFHESVLPSKRPATGENAPFTALFVLENGKHTVHLDNVSLVTGTDENNAYSTLLTMIASKRKGLEALTEDFKSDNPFVYEAAEKKYNEIEDDIVSNTKSYILSNPGKQTAAVLLYNFRYSLNEEERREIIQKADETFISVPGISQIVDHLKVLDGVAVGKHFIDFDMNNIKGQPDKLSHYVGNGRLILLDFWASWCPPCRKEMPHLVELYNKYKKDGFGIVGISLDSTQDAWEKGVKDLNITWPQLSDLQGWKNSGAALYGVNLIPQLVLVDKDGTIIAKDIHGDKLEAKIEEVLSR